jgi:hypothetical protein
MRTIASHAARELEAVEGTGHGDIANERANLSALGHSERVLAIRGDDHVEARLAEHVRQVDAHERLILDDEDGGHTFRVNAVHVRDNGGRGCPFQGKGCKKRRAAGRFVDGAVVRVASQRRTGKVTERAVPSDDRP